MVGKRSEKLTSVAEHGTRRLVGTVMDGCPRFQAFLWMWLAQETGQGAVMNEKV